MSPLKPLSANGTPLFREGKHRSPAEKKRNGNHTTNSENSIEKESLEKSARESQRDLNKVIEVDRINFNRKGVLMDDAMNKAPPTYITLDKIIR